MAVLSEALNHMADEISAAHTGSSSASGKEHTNWRSHNAP